MIIKGGDVLEDTRAVDVIVLDKTGTVTEAAMTVTEVFGGDLSSGEIERVRELAASAEGRSEHPIASAIADTVDSLHPVSEFENLVGSGVQAIVDGEEITVGRRTIFQIVPANIESRAANAEQRGATVVFAGRDKTAEIIFVLTDRVKETSAAAVEFFHSLGMAVTLLTGDNERTAHAVATEVGIGTHPGDDVIAEVFPDGKAATVAALQGNGHRVAMVGDGINDCLLYTSPSPRDS